ncbi:hypothetical protein [Alteribacter keqinensis]|uniref:Uncharacterized protein n=1 Tax=Alteribacter keqinensis TaxID=2483800 RepID=A0A3M7TS93_9BACI|nr:hypothetical protein [Alteribacter keqinensis]RNA68528.1 hypothetical protein EBO34_00710 [Alteribacter keqinensis]
MKDERLFYYLMSAIFAIVIASSGVYVFQQAAEQEFSFPNHLLLIGLAFGIWAILRWKRKSYPFAFILTLLSAYALLMVVFTMLAM